MNTDWIFNNENFSLQQEFDPEISNSNPCDNSNVAQLTIDHPRSFNVTKGHDGDVDFSQLSVDIPADIMDELAVAWLRTRGKKIVNNP